MLKPAMTSQQLPEAVADIASVIGHSKALILIDNLGGRVFSVPMGNLASNNKNILISLIGDKAANDFMGHYGGESLYIPQCKQTLTNIRNDQFCADVATSIANGNNKTSAIQQLAMQYGFSERWGYNLLSKANN